MQVRVHIPPELAAGAETAEGVPPDMPMPALIRFALATLAKWPAGAALAIAQPRRNERGAA